MLFKDFRNQNYFKDKEEIVINKKLNVRGKEILILSFIKHEGKSKLWTLHKNNFRRDSDYELKYSTNREEILNTIEMRENGEQINFRSMNIQNTKLDFVYSQTTTIQYANGMDILTINHFIKSGLLSTEWDNINIEDMMFTIYEIDEGNEFPIISKNEKIEIFLYIEEEHVEKVIQHPFKVSIGEYDKGTKIYYKDYDGSENFFYIDELVKYDIWKKTIEDINANIGQIDEEYRDMYRSDLLSGIESICPKNMDYTAINYENEENLQLRFLSKDYLEKIPAYNNGSTSLLMLIEEDKGKNGYYLYSDGIEPVEKDFSGEIEIELFSKFIKIPEETIGFEI